MNNYEKGIQHGKSIMLLTMIHWLESVDDNFPFDRDSVELIKEAMKQGIYKERD